MSNNNNRCYSCGSSQKDKFRKEIVDIDKEKQHLVDVSIPRASETNQATREEVLDAKNIHGAKVNQGGVLAKQRAATLKRLGEIETDIDQNDGEIAEAKDVFDYKVTVHKRSTKRFRRLNHKANVELPAQRRLSANAEFLEI